MAGRQSKTDDKVRVQIVVTERDLREIDRAANAKGISRTLFLVAAARDAVAAMKVK